MAKTIKTQFQFKRGSSNKWNELNPILAVAEPGFETDTGLLKIGDGVTAWKELKYSNNIGDFLTEEDLKLLIDDKDIFITDVVLIHEERIKALEEKWPEITAADAGKFLRINENGKVALDLVDDVTEVGR